MIAYAARTGTRRNLDALAAADAGRAVWRYVRRPAVWKTPAALQVDVNRDGRTSKQQAADSGGVNGALHHKETP